MVRHAAAILLLIVLIPAAAAVQNVTLANNGYVQERGVQSVTITYVFSDPDALGTTIYYPDSQGEQQGIFQDAQQCTDTCTFRFSTDLQETLQLYFFEEADAAQRQEFSFSIQTDDQPPRIQNTLINDCEQATCAIGEESTITVTLTDDKSGVDEESITFTLAGRTTQATCISAETYTCTAPVPAARDGTITMSYADKAGNSEQAQIATVTVDTEAPRIIGPVRYPETYGDDPDVLPAVTDLTFSITVEEPELPRIRMQTSWENTTGSCEREEEYYECRVSVRTPENRAYDETAEIIITDKAGNPARRSVDLNIIASDESFTPNYWRTEVRTIRTAIDPLTWQVNPAVLPVDLKLERTSSARVQPASIRVSGCTLNGSVSTQPGSEIDVTVQPAADTSTTFTLTLAPKGEEISVRESDIIQEAQVRCEAEILTRSDAAIITKAEREELVIDLNFYRLPDPSTALKIKYNKSVEKTREIERKAANLRATMLVAQSLCSAFDATQNAKTSMNTAAAALVPFVPASKPGVDSLDTSTRTVQQASGALADAGGWMCKLVTCDLSGGPYADLWGLNEQDSTAGKWNTFLNNAGLGEAEASGLMDPYSSFIVAVGSFCGPAIQYHYENYLSIQCGEQRCIQDSLQGLTSPQQCAYVSRQQTCEFFSGAVVNAVPYVNMYETALGKVKGALANPYSLIGIGSVFACDVLPESVGRTVCKLPEYAQEIQDSARMVEQIQQAIQTAEYYTNQGSGYCEQVQQQGIPRSVLGDPFRQSGYCNAGITTLKDGDDKYISAGGEQCRCVQTDTDARPDDALGGYTGCAELICEPSEIPSHVQQELARSHEMCKETFDVQIEQLDGWVPMSDAQKAYNDQISNVQDARSAVQEQSDREYDTRQAALEQARERREQIEYEDAPQGDIDTELAIQMEKEFFASVSQQDINAYLRGETDALSQEQAQTLAAIIPVDDVRAQQQELSDRREELNTQEEQLEEEADELKEARAALEYEAIQKGLQEPAGYIRRTVNTAMVFGQLGAAAGNLFGYDVNNNPTGEVLESMREGIDQVSVSRQFTKAYCAQTVDEPDVDEAVFSRSGEPLAFISATASRIGESREYSYKIDVAITTQNQRDEEVALLLDGRTVEILDISTPIARVRTDAIPAQGVLAREACIQFESSLKNYFGEQLRGADADSKRLCTEVQLR